MTAGSIETAKDGGGNGESLRGSLLNASAQSVLPEIPPRKRFNTPSSKRRIRLPILESEVELPERPATVVGLSPSGKSRINVSIS